jgi:hypothetical protein
MADPIDAQDRPIVTRAKAKASGLKRYFTGVPCKRGHLSERTLHNNECNECHNAARRAGHAAAKAQRPLRT